VFTGSGSGACAEATSAMIEKEKHKLEVLKRRQERDIQQARFILAAAPSMDACAHEQSSHVF
jgi:hypothetical protein